MRGRGRGRPSLHLYHPACPFSAALAHARTRTRAHLHTPTLVASPTPRASAQKSGKGGKKKKKEKELVVTKAVRNKRKCITTVTGLHHWKVKLSEGAYWGRPCACISPRVTTATHTRTHACVHSHTSLTRARGRWHAASKLFGKKFACGASVTKNASQVEEIDIQGDCLYEVTELILKKYPDVDKDAIYWVEDKKKRKADL